jgi:hypothetical protein
MPSRNNKLRIKIHALLLSISFLCGCSPKRQRKIYIVSPTLSGKPLQQKDSVIPATKKITIFVHGTSQTVNSIRFIPFLYDVVSMRLRTPEGLLHYKELPEYHTFIKCATSLHGTAPREFPLETFYFFGWSGKLSPKERKKGAYKLYAAIKTLQSSPEFHDAEITIITHSHGGNVALYLGSIIEENQDTALKIKRLILTGCPIQDETEGYAQSPLFETIYNLYSVIDFLQVADPQGLEHQRTKHITSLFSRREIALDPMPSNIKQAAIRLNGYPLHHIDFIRPPFHKELPYMLEILDNECMRNNLPTIRQSSYQVNLLTHTSCRYYRSEKRIITFN